ncbi:hypothetical protein ACFL2J_01630 [Candidatus Omnitrophota bacterium]
MLMSRRLLKLVKGNEGMSIVMLFVYVLVIGMVTTTIYHVVERPKRGVNAPKGLDELIKQLDKTIDSVGEKAKMQPFEFAVVEEVEAQDNDKLSLSGVLWSGDDSLAIINKKIVGITDRVGDCWVTDIQENSVSLRCRGGGEKTLSCY